jgi:DNA-binding GntR family transcriptional regulator
VTSPEQLPDPRAFIAMAAQIRLDITEGRLKRGDPAPSVTALSRQTGHARQTCARALQILQDEGLVTRFAGLGYFVCAPPAAQPRPQSHDTEEEPT